MSTQEWLKLKSGSIIEMKRTKWKRTVLDFRKESSCISLARKYFGETIYCSGDKIYLI